MAELAPLIPDTLAPSARGTFRGQGGFDIAFARWEHPAPKGRVVISHGYGEHGERYAHTAKWLHDLGWAVTAIDHRGFGRSGGPRGDAQGIRGFVEDLTACLHQERLHDRTEGRGGGPQVLLGHSFGGLVALLVALWHPDAAEGLILSSPAVKLWDLSRVMGLLHRALLFLAPHRAIDLPNNKSLVCSDPILVQRYWADPLCHRRITAAYAEVFEEGRREILGMGAEVDLPILLLEAGNDTVVDPDASEALWSALRPGLLERHRLPDFRHEVFHDLHRARAQELCEPWLEKRRAERNPAPLADIPA